MVALDLINAAMRIAGVGDPNTALSAEDAQIGLDSLNEMLDDWSLQNLAVFSLLGSTYNLVSGQASYTVGPDVLADFNGVRPVQIENMRIRYNSIDYPIRQITNDDYNLIPYKTQAGPLPWVVYYNPTFPLAMLTFWPVPNQVLPIFFPMNERLVTAALASTVMVLPPGYKRAIQFNLAVDLCDIYNRDVPPGVEKRAIRSLADVKRANIKPQEIGVDAALHGIGGPGSFGSNYANFIAGNI